METLLTSGPLVYMAAGIDLLSLAVIGREALMYEASRQNALGMNTRSFFIHYRLPLSEFVSGSINVL